VDAAGGSIGGLFSQDNRTSMLAQVPVSLLETLWPFKQLPPDGLQRLADSASCERLEAGSVFLFDPLHTEFVHVVVGKLQMLCAGVTVETVEGGSERARLPLFSIDGRATQARATGTSAVVRVQRDTYLNIAADEGIPIGNVDEPPLSERESAMVEAIEQACQSGTLELPTIPEVALRVRELAASEDAGIAELARLVQTDGVIAARLVEVSNSAFYRGNQKCTTIKQAVTRLGFKATCNITVSMSLRGLFTAASGTARRAMRDQWAASVEASAAAYVIAQRCTKMDPDRALLAALLHNIGAIPVIAYSENMAARVDARQIQQTVKALSKQVGGMVLQAWEMDDELVAVAQEHGHWQREGRGEFDLVDLVNLAILFSTDDDQALPVLEEIPAYRKLATSAPGLDLALDELKATGEEIRTVKAFLA